MRTYKNKIEQFVEFLEPPSEELSPKFELKNVFTLFNQDKFNKYIGKLPFEVQGDITENEEKVLKNIKDEIRLLQNKFPDAKPERLEFDLAKIFHSNLKQLGFGRFHVDDVGMWRWMSMNYFKEETFWRRAKSDFEKRDYSVKPAKATFEHCVGKRSRDIFPRRYFIIGQRLFDANTKYVLVEKLAEKSRAGRTGGFGNLISYMVDTKLISPNDYVSKTVANIMLTGEKLGGDVPVKLAFVRYNAYRKRLLNNAAENVFRNEICIMED